MNQNIVSEELDFVPTEMFHGQMDGGVLLLCDHARNDMPFWLKNLGLPKSQLDRHIGYDIGARELTLELSKRLQAPAVLTTYSRLLIDPNRGEDDPTLVMRLSDGAVIPGNAAIDAEERRQRIETYHRPYHDLVDGTLDEMMALAPPPVIISIHSFTPVWRGEKRPWHATVLWDLDERAVRPVLDGLGNHPDLCVADNEPYDGALKNDTIYRHATRRGLANALLEVRQDLISDDAGVNNWANILTPILNQVREEPRCRTQARYASRCDM
ncbi:putative N-formylglutamate amidohydrolase [Roseibium hamelinense]|uniref:Putative N-formylglutamate amidohydrolase n=1 Tax=Roseibium hamelinense TaxID=150831 RepID=A0A562SNP9_9HYPH|nr:N-formylglutamate amidohydrolase [Roseibium hamelinense]MTI45042.1 N-formylglutamate amidohydrolase [Roseibium hamelinense]TWI82306.1 putative N-formylglutamate amidohydrolase [Roseibium hamelinense]